MFAQDKLITLANALRRIGSLEAGADVEGLSHAEGPEGRPSGMARLEDIRLGFADRLKIGDVDPPGDNPVESVQDLLLGKGYYMSAGADGSFGPQTEDAVFLFQERNKGSVPEATGEVDKSTLLSLESSSSLGPEERMLEEEFEAGDIAGCSEREITAFMLAMSAQESGGSYTIENEDTGAHGRYQIMPGNWPRWSKEVSKALEIPGLDGAERTPENQEIVAKYKMCEYYKKYRDWWLVAVAWYSGPGRVGQLRRARSSSRLARYRHRISSGGTSTYPGIASYADKIIERYNEQLGILTDTAVASLDSDVEQKGTLILGDSQAVGNFGKALGTVVPDLIDNISGVGWTSKDIPIGRIDNILLSSNPELVVIAFGGNGPGEDAELVDLVSAPGRKIVWVGAFPPTSPVLFPRERHWRTDLYTEEGVEKARTNRNRTNSTIKAAVGSRATFINPYDYLENSDGSPGYTCRGACDGIHLPRRVARMFASMISSELV